MPIEGVELFTEREGQWYRLGEHLPVFGVPIADEATGVPLDKVIIPGKLAARAVAFGENARPAAARAARARPRNQEARRPATGLRCGLRVLVVWAEQSTSSELSKLQAAWLGAGQGAAGDAEAIVAWLAAGAAAVVGERAALGERSARSSAGLSAGSRSARAGTAAHCRAGPADPGGAGRGWLRETIGARGVSAAHPRPGVRLAAGELKQVCAGPRKPDMSDFRGTHTICRFPPREKLPVVWRAAAGAVRRGGGVSGGTRGGPHTFAFAGEIAVFLEGLQDAGVHCSALGLCCISSI